jgi:hypothetical protein
MNPKGRTPVNPVIAEPPNSRRSLMSTVGVAGLAAAAGMLAVARPAAAADEAPFTPTQADARRLLVMLKLELTASNLYLSSLGAGLGGDATEVATVYAENHRQYAQQIAGVTGLKASGNLDSVFKRFEVAFATSDVTKWARASFELENTFVATHTQAIGKFDAIEAVNLVTSILVIEARQAVVAAGVGGFSDDPEVLSGGAGVKPIDIDAEAS